MLTKFMILRKDTLSLFFDYAEVYVKRDLRDLSTSSLLIEGTGGGALRTLSVSSRLVARYLCHFMLTFAHSDDAS